jgi:hypothetical protein
MTCNIPPYKRTFSTHFSLSSLQIVQRSRETTVQVIALPEGGYDPAEDLPFRLHAQLKMMNQPFRNSNGTLLVLSWEESNVK